MILILHIAIALSSIILSTYAFFAPSKRLLGSSYGLVGLTFVSGFYLVYMVPSHVMEACTTGLVYLAIVSLALIAARQKLATQQAVK